MNPIVAPEVHKEPLLFRPQSLPVNFTLDTSSNWTDPIVQAWVCKRATSVPPSTDTFSFWQNKSVQTNETGLRVYRNKKTCLEVRKRRSAPYRLPKETIPKWPRNEFVADKLTAYLDPRTTETQLPFVKPSPLAQLVQCCQRLLHEQNPAPFRRVLPERQMDEAVRSHTAGTLGDYVNLVADTKHTPPMDGVFSALDSLINGRPWYSWTWSNTLDSRPVASMPSASSWHNAPGHLFHKSPLLSLTPPDATRKPSERDSIKSENKTTDRYRCSDNPSTRQVMTEQSWPSPSPKKRENPLPLEHNPGILDAKPISCIAPLGSDNLFRHHRQQCVLGSKACECILCTQSRILYMTTTGFGRSDANSPTRNRQVPSVTDSDKQTCHTKWHETSKPDESHKPNEPDLPKDTTASWMNTVSASDSDPQGVGPAESDTTRDTMQHAFMDNRIATLTNLMLLTALFRHTVTTVPPTRPVDLSNPREFPCETEPGSVHSIRTAQTGGGTSSAATAVPVTSSTTIPNILGCSQSPTVLSALLSLLTAPTLSFPKL